LAPAAGRGGNSSARRLAEHLAKVNNLVYFYSVSKNQEQKSAARKSVDSAKRNSKRLKRVYKAVKRTVKLLIKAFRAVVRSARRVAYIAGTIGAPIWIFLAAMVLFIVMLVVIINLGEKASGFQGIDQEELREIIAQADDSGVKEEIDEQLGDSVIVALDCSTFPPDQRQPGINCLEGLIEEYEKGKGNKSPVPERANYMVPVWKAAAKRYQVPWIALAAINGARSNFGLKNCQNNSTGSGVYQLRDAAWENFAFDGGSTPMEPAGTNCYKVKNPKELNQQERKNANNNAPVNGSSDSEERIDFIKTPAIKSLPEDFRSGPSSTADIYDPVDAAFTQARILARNGGFKTKNWDKYTGSGPGECSTKESVDGQVWYHQPEAGALDAGGPGAKYGYNKKLKIPSRALKVAAKYRSNRGKWRPRSSLGAPSMPKKDIVYLLRTAWQAFGVRGAELNRNVTLNYAQVGLESGGSPQLIQVCGGYVDINCAQNNPARGMMQFIPGTFKSWKVDGFNDIYNPLDNILAAVNAQVNSRMSILDGGSGWGPGAGSNPYTTGGKSKNVAPADSSGKKGPAKSLPYKGKKQTDRLSKAVAYSSPGGSYTDCYVAVVHRWYRAIKKNPPEENVIISGPLRQRIVKIAQAEHKKGVAESGGDNVPRYTKSGKIAPYNISDLWCQSFAAWVWYQAGFKQIAKVPGMTTSSGLALPSYTGTVSAAASAKQYGMTFKTKNPLPGDFIFWGVGHVEIVEKVKNGRVISTIGGNTSNAVTRVSPPSSGYTHFVSPPAKAGKSAYKFASGGKKSGKDPEKKFMKLAEKYNLQVGLAVNRQGYSTLYGNQQLVKSWSTIFVPLAVVLIRQRGGYQNLSASQRRAVRAAVRRSDGAAAAALFDAIDNNENKVYKKMNALFRSLDDITTINRQSAGRPIEKLSTTTWSLRGANRFFSALAQGKLLNKRSTKALLRDMSQVTGKQQWGFGRRGAGYKMIKGGWAQRAEYQNRFLIRQSVIINKKTVVSLAITPTQARSQQALNENMSELAKWVKKNLKDIPRGNKDSKLMSISGNRSGNRSFPANGTINGRGLTVKGSPANAKQRRVAYQIITESLKYNPPRKALYAILQGATVESVMGTRGMNTPVDLDSIGILQGRQMYHSKKNLQSIPYNVRIFMTKSYTGRGGAIKYVKQNPGLSSGIIAADNLGPASRYRYRYDLYRKEAEKWVKAFYNQR